PSAPLFPYTTLFRSIKNSLLSSTTSMMRRRSSDSLSLKAIQRNMPIIVGKISGVIRVASRNDFFFTLARYSLLITNRILCMIVVFYFLDEDVTDRRDYLLKAYYLPNCHQVSEYLIGRGAVEWDGKAHIIFKFSVVGPMVRAELLIFQDFDMKSVGLGIFSDFVDRTINYFLGFVDHSNMITQQLHGLHPMSGKDDSCAGSP